MLVASLPEERKRKERCESEFRTTTYCKPFDRRCKRKKKNAPSSFPWHPTQLLRQPKHVRIDRERVPRQAEQQHARRRLRTDALEALERFHGVLVRVGVEIVEREEGRLGFVAQLV
jgi:hypothetical protein